MDESSDTHNSRGIPPSLYRERGPPCTSLRLPAFAFLISKGDYLGGSQCTHLLAVLTPVHYLVSLLDIKLSLQDTGEQFKMGPELG